MIGRPCLYGIVATFALLLAACGGGSGGSGSPPSTPPAQEPPPPPSPTAEDVSAARQAQVNVLFKTGNGELLIQWTDTFASETSYRVERQLTANGSWEVQESLPAAAATGTPYSWTRIIDQSATYRVVATKSDYVVPLEPEPGVAGMRVNVGTNGPQLVLDQTADLVDIVRLSVQGASSARQVEYFIDLQSFRTTRHAPAFPVDWDTSTAPDGRHLIIAHVELATGLTVELRREVVTANRKVAVRLRVEGNGALLLKAIATSANGMRSVELFKDGAFLGTGYRGAPNDPTYDPSLYMFNYDARSHAPGPVTFSVVATDGIGEQASASVPFTIDNSPQLTLLSPVDGQIAIGSLELQGAHSDDLPGAAVTAHLGDLQIFQTNQSSFSHTYSLAGVPGGQYTLTVRATDSTGQVSSIQRSVIVPPPDLSYQRVGTLPANTTIVATAAGRLLYRLADGTMRLRLANSSEVDLQGAAQIMPLESSSPGAAQPWQLSADRVATVGRLAGVAKVFLFDDSGARAEVPYDSSSDAHDTNLRAGLHGSWLVWGNERIYMRNLASPGTDLGPITGELYRGHALTTAPGNETLFFSVGTDLFRYQLADQSTLLLSNADASRPAADQSRIAWRTLSPQQLVVAPLSNPTAATVMATTAPSSFELDGGVLTWTQQAVNGPVRLLVNDGAATATLSNLFSTALHSARSGNVIYSEFGKLYLWTATQGRRVLLDTLPSAVIQRDDVVFLTLGSSEVTIYRVEL